MSGCIKLFRKEIEREKQLDDPELRLYLLYRRLADWDPRHKETFGTVKLPIRAIKSSCLPEKNWSVGKISETTNRLIAKGFLKRLPANRIAVENYWLYQERVQRAERAFQLIENGVQVTEANIRQLEQIAMEENKRRYAKMREDAGFSQKSFGNLNEPPR